MVKWFQQGGSRDQRSQRGGQQDFARRKTKVGKSAAPKDNHTDTAFAAKSVRVRAQRLDRATSAASLLSLCRHHQAAVRRQAVADLSALDMGGADAAAVLDGVAPLISDPDRLVRQAVLQLLRGADPELLRPRVHTVLLRVHAAMTHITLDVRAESTRFLDALLQTCGAEVVRVGFRKTLLLFFPLQGWALDDHGDGAKLVTTALAFGRAGGKTRLTHLQALERLLDAGLAEEAAAPALLLHPDTHKFLVPAVRDPFAQLRGSADVTEDVDARRAVVAAVRPALVRGLAAAAKDGGELGRLCGRVRAKVEASSELVS